LSRWVVRMEQFIQITWLLCGHGLESKQGKFILDSKMHVIRKEGEGKRGEGLQPPNFNSWCSH